MKYKINTPTDREVDGAKSLSHNDALFPIIELLSPRGPILVIEATKRDTVALAKSIADKQATDESDAIRELAEFVEAKLSNAHPLSRVVKKGVAYHHGSLPNDIRTEIEKAVSDGIIKVLVATTTMTEGVNLPVQAVVISKVGTYQDNQEFLKIIKGSKMANAIGRAGRATQETEGCVVLFHRGNVDTETFKALDPDDQEKWVTSNLATQEFLSEVAEYEALKLTTADAIFECRSPMVSGFLSFAWFYLYTVSPEGEPDQGRIDRFLQNTMGWLQGTPESKAAISTLTSDIKTKYIATPNAPRKLFAKSGSKLGTTKILKTVFDTIKANLTDDKSDLEFIKVILSDATLPTILTVAEAPTRRIFNMRSGHRNEIEIPLIEILEDWINGFSYPALADKYLADVTDPDFRFEQLGDYISGYFDNFLPWVVGAIIGWANDSDDIEEPLPAHLPGIIRGGVPNKTALITLHQGIYSRQLATNIAAWKLQNCPEVSPYRIRPELQANTLEKLIQDLAPSPSELRNLIEFLTDNRTQMLSSLNEHGVCTLDLWSNDATTPGDCQIRGSGLRDNFSVFRGDVLVGTVPTKYHVEMRTLIKSGIPTVAQITEDSKLELSVTGFEAAD